MAGIISPTISSTLPSDAATSSNQTDGSQQTKIKEVSPTDSTKTNGSYVLSFNAAGDCVYVDETIAGITYRATFTRSDMVVSTTLPISASVQL
jgi:hypothetical protein